MRFAIPISRRSVFYNASVLALSGIALQALGFLYRILQSRLIGAEGMGMYSLIQPVYGLITSVTLSGICMAVNHLSAKADARGSCGALPRIFQAGAVFFVLLFTGMSIVLIIGNERLASVLLGNPDAGRAALLFLPCIFLTGFENLCKNACYGLKRVGEPSVSEITEQVIRIGAVWLVILLLRPGTPLASAECVILGMTASEVFSSLFMTICLTRVYRRKGEGGPPFPGRISAEVMKIAFPVSLSAILGNLISAAVTLILPERLAAAGLAPDAILSDIGRINGMAAPFMFLPLVFVYPVGSAVSPRITGSLARGDKKDARRKAARDLETAMLLAAPLSLLLTPPGPWLMKCVFGAETDEKTLFLLALGVIASAFQSASSSVLIGYGKHRFAMFSGLVGGAIHLTVTWFLAKDPAFGILGQVVGMAVGSFAAALSNAGMLRFGLRLRLSWKRILFRPFAAALFAVLCEKAAFRLMGGGLPGAVVGGTAGLVAATLLCSLFGYRIRAYLRTLIPRKRLQDLASGRSTRLPPESAEETAASAYRTASGSRSASEGRRSRGSLSRRARRKPEKA